MGKQKKKAGEKIRNVLKKLILTVEKAVGKIIQIKRKNKVIICICAIAAFIIPIVAPSFLDLMIEKSERFKPTVLFYEQEISQDVTYKIICSCYGGENLPIIMEMPITIINQSHKSSENLTILFSFTDNVSPVPNDKVVIKGYGINPDNINRSVSKDVSPVYDGSLLSIPDINPNETYNISEYVRVDNSDKTFTVMQVKISSKDMESYYYTLCFYFVDIPDEELYEYIENQLKLDWDKEDIFILFPVLNKGSDQDEEVVFLTHAAMLRVKPKK